MYQSNAHSSKNRSAPLIVALLIVLLLSASILFGVILGKSDAQKEAGILPAQKPEQNAPTSSPSEGGQTLVACLSVSETLYLPTSAWTEGGTLDGHVFTVEFGGHTWDFCADTYDYFCDGKLAFLEHAPILKDGELLLPASDFDGFSALSLTETDGAVKVNTDDLSAVFCASVESAPTLPAGVSAAQYFDSVTRLPVFTTDLSEYEAYMNPADRDGFLILANTDRSLGESFAPDNLLVVERARYAEESYKARLQEPAAKALDAFLREAYAAGYSDVTVTSGYRSYYDQEYRFNTKVNSLLSDYDTLEEAKIAAGKVIQPPGHSEHQTGLACDMHNLPAADVSFDNEPAAKWLRENAHNFGFILRYPADKIEVTGISFEPWHFRFVGRYHATRMSLLHLTLEEYLEFFPNLETPA